VENVVDITSEISEDQLLLSLLNDCLLESEDIAETPQTQNVLKDNLVPNFGTFNTDTSPLSWPYLDQDTIGILSEKYDFTRVGAAHDNNDINNEGKKPMMTNAMNGFCEGTKTFDLCDHCCETSK
jgi:hypothetical protein